jgi:predicted RNA-binding protein with PUA-like domain
VRGGHPDPTAFDRHDKHYDPKSDPSQPTWYQVSIKGIRAIDPPLGLPFLKTVDALAGMQLLRTGSRLSVQPVSKTEWQTILALARSKNKR